MHYAQIKEGVERSHRPDVTPLYTHYAKVQKHEQGKIGLQFFDMWG